jgi:hypothetical protein
MAIVNHGTKPMPPESVRRGIVSRGGLVMVLTKTAFATLAGRRDFALKGGWKNLHLGDGKRASLSPFVITVRT